MHMRVVLCGGGTLEWRNVRIARICDTTWAKVSHSIHTFVFRAEINDVMLSPQHFTVECMSVFVCVSVSMIAMYERGISC